MAESLRFSSRKPMQNQHGFLAVHLSVLDLDFFFFFLFLYQHINGHLQTHQRKKRKTMTEVGNRKKTDKFLFHKNLTPGTLQRSFFFSWLFIIGFSSKVLAWMCQQGLHNSTLSQWKNKKFRRPKALPESLSSVSSCLLRYPVPCMREEHCWRAMVDRVLQGEVALLSTVVLTSTETCQARSLGLGQGQTLQERWVLQRPKKESYKLKPIKQKRFNLTRNLNEIKGCSVHNQDITVPLKSL